MNSAEATVCGGFPVRVDYSTHDAEPDVGIMSWGIAEMTILTTKGKPADFIESKMTDADYQACESACYEAELARQELIHEDWRY